MKKKIIGFTTGVRDLFHIGHLNLLKNAKGACDKLIVGVTSDERTFHEKGKYPCIPFAERKEILEHITVVDQVIEHKYYNEYGHYEDLHFDVVFKGSDREGSEKRKRLEKDFELLGVKVIFFPLLDSHALFTK